MTNIERLMLNSKLQTLGRFCFEIANMLDYYAAAYPDEPLPDDEKMVLDKKIEQLKTFIQMVNDYLEKEQIENVELTSFLSDLKNKYHTELAKIDENEISS